MLRESSVHITYLSPTLAHVVGDFTEVLLVKKDTFNELLAALIALFEIGPTEENLQQAKAAIAKAEGRRA